MAAHFKEKKVLLILDNLEQVLECASDLQNLLQSTQHLHLFVTSRSALTSYGEFLFPLRPFPLPQSSQSLDHLLENTAVTLFITRTQAINPRFQLTETNAEHVVAICQRLDGLPLAIELAAARSRLFTPQALLQQLENDAHILQSSQQGVPARQQTIEAMLDWSYHLLRETAQHVFDRLAIICWGVYSRSGLGNLAPSTTRD